MSVSIRLFVDGASRGNPGKAGVGCYAIDQESSEVLFEHGCYLGIATNNVAEYAALTLGLFTLSEQYPNATITVCADSELLVKQMNGVYRVKNPVLAHWYALAQRLVRPLNCRIMHVRREKNAAADERANAGIDHRVTLPAAFIEFTSPTFTLPLEKSHARS